MHSRGGGSWQRTSVDAAARAREARAHDRRVADERTASTRGRRRARERDRRRGRHAPQTGPAARAGCGSRVSVDRVRRRRAELEWFDRGRGRLDGGGRGCDQARRPSAGTARGGADPGCRRAQRRRPGRRAPSRRRAASPARRHRARRRGSRDRLRPTGRTRRACLRSRIASTRRRLRPRGRPTDPQSAAAEDGAGLGRHFAAGPAELADDGRWGDRPAAIGWRGRAESGRTNERRTPLPLRSPSSRRVHARLPTAAARGVRARGRGRDRYDVARRHRRDPAGCARRRAHHADPGRSGSRTHTRGVGAAVRQVRDGTAHGRHRFRGAHP